MYWQIPFLKSVSIDNANLIFHVWSLSLDRELWMSSCVVSNVIIHCTFSSTANV